MKLSELLDKLGITCNEGRGSNMEVSDAWENWYNPWQMGFVLKIIAIKKGIPDACKKVAAAFGQEFKNDMAFSAGFDTYGMRCDEIRRIVPDPLVFMAQ